MMRLLALCCLPAVAMATKWAVIAVGSKGYWNYRHQADACHAYQLMKQSGIAEENIILMMQDDVADSNENPFKGKLFNKPGNNSPDVYEGCKVDYKGDIVTAELFMNVLTGNVSGVPANGKILKSGPDDKVFVNFVDHGGVGIVSFPNGPSLHVSDLSATLKAMSQKKMFKQLLFYMEACESGSMFPNVTADGKILAVTAANGHESSWGTYCGHEAVVNGKSIGSCLGDLFSISWMEDSDLWNASELVGEQVRRVTNRTNKSHVQTFGDQSLNNETIGEFQLKVKGDRTIPETSAEGTWDSRDIYVQQAIWNWQQAKTESEKADSWAFLQKVMSDRQEDHDFFSTMVQELCPANGLEACTDQLHTKTSRILDLECHRRLVRSIADECPPSEVHDSTIGWNGFNMKYAFILANACDSQHLLDKDSHALDAFVRQQCTQARLKRAKAQPILVV